MRRVGAQHNCGEVFVTSLSQSVSTPLPVHAIWTVGSASGKETREVTDARCERTGSAEKSGFDPERKLLATAIGHIEWP